MNIFTTELQIRRDFEENSEIISFNSQRKHANCDPSSMGHDICMEICKIIPKLSLSPHLFRSTDRRHRMVFKILVGRQKAKL